LNRLPPVTTSQKDRLPGASRSWEATESALGKAFESKTHGTILGTHQVTTSRLATRSQLARRTALRRGAGAISVPTVSARPVNSARPRPATSKPWHDLPATAEPSSNRFAKTLAANTTTETEAYQSRIGTRHWIGDTSQSRHDRSDRNDREHRATNKPNTTQPIAAAVHFFPTAAATGIHSQTALT